MTRVEWAWRCLDPECPEKGAGEQAAVHRAAEKHTKAACHGTIAGGEAR
jgi:hypothetical protein